jgi:hypothetical protein
MVGDGQVLASPHAGPDGPLVQPLLVLDDAPELDDPPELDDAALDDAVPVLLDEAEEVLEHAPPMQTLPPLQTVPHAPQLLSSV